MEQIFEKNDRDISIANYIENNDTFLREKLTNILDNIKIYNFKNFNEFKLEKDFSFWLLSNFEEKNLYKKNKFYELTKVIAVIEIAKTINFNHTQIDIEDEICKEILNNILNCSKIQKYRSLIFSFYSFFKKFKVDLIFEFYSFFKSTFFLLKKLFFSRKKNFV